MPRHATPRPTWSAALLIAAGLTIGAAIDLDDPVRAASPDAWEQFQQDVAEHCSAAAGLQSAQVRLDPFGTEHYGVARVTGRAAGGDWQTVVCVLRKTPDGPADVEISAPVQDWIAAR